MIEEGYDLVIRVNPDADEALIGKPFLQDRLVAVAAPHLFRPAAGMRVPIVVRGDGAAQRWEMTTPVGCQTLDVEPVLTLASMIMVRDAARAGAGAARLPISLVSRDSPRAV